MNSIGLEREVLAFNGYISGYDTGVISGALVVIGPDLGPPQVSDGQKASCHAPFSSFDHPIYIQRPLCDLDTLERSFIGLASFLELVNCQVLIIMCLQMQEFITSATTLGALLGSLAAGVMSDWTGRKPVLGIADIIFIGGAIAQAVCHGVWSMVCLPSAPTSIH